MYPGSYPQSWTTMYYDSARRLEADGHTIYHRGDGAHHDSGTCGKCREEAAQKDVNENSR